MNATTFAAPNNAPSLTHLTINTGNVAICPAHTRDLTPPKSTLCSATSSCRKGKGSNAKRSDGVSRFIEMRPSNMTTPLG